MNRTLFLSDKSTPEVLRYLEFMYGFKPDHVININNVRQYTQNTVEERTVIHLNQQPLTLASNVPSEKFLELMALPPYNLHKQWLSNFDSILVTFYDLSKNDRYVVPVK